MKQALLSGYLAWDAIITIRNTTATVIRMMPITIKTRFLCSGAGMSMLTAPGCSPAGRSTTGGCSTIFGFLLVVVAAGGAGGSNLAVGGICSLAVGSC